MLYRRRDEINHEAGYSGYCYSWVLYGIACESGASFLNTSADSKHLVVDDGVIVDDGVMDGHGVMNQIEVNLNVDIQVA